LPRKPEIERVSVSSLEPSLHLCRDRKLLDLIPLIHGAGPTMAVAVDESGAVLDGNHVICCLLMLGHDTVDVFRVEAGTAAAEVEQLRRLTSSVSAPVTGFWLEHMIRLQLDRPYRRRRVKSYTPF
jgi:hypothetical protein